MNKQKLKPIKIISALIVYSSLILFVSSYFDLDIPTETLLAKLRSKLLISLLFGALLVFLDDWLLKKGGLSKQEKDD